jgi:primary-amine oxidase
VASVAIIFRAIAVTILSLCAFSLCAATHPMDALDANEISAAADLLKSAGKADERTLYASITLLEPAKSFVLHWKPGDSFSRQASIVFRREAATYEAVVDLTAKQIVSLKEVPGAQPFVTLPEMLNATKAVIADARMQEGFRKRGLTDFEKIICIPRTVGNFGEKQENTKRLLKMDCVDIRDVKTNIFAKPIEGLFATVDLDTNKVLSVTDLGIVPIPKRTFDLDPDSIGAQREVKPVEQSFPKGSNIRMNGSFIDWQNWSFHIRWDIRAGVVISLVKYNNRSILYEGSLAEIFVPYQDPTEGWYYRNYMDEGDYGFGTNAFTLVRGSDCPASATFLSPVMSNTGGGADTLQNIVCIFERAPGEPVWRHYDFIKESLQSRPATELVVRYIASVGNYDYVLDWIFDQKGNITYRAGATGIDSVKGVASQTIDDPTARTDTAWGTLVSPGRVGIHHDHFLSVRLDLDVDGTDNTFMQSKLVEQPQPEGSKRRSVWKIQDESATTDTEAKFRLSYEHPSMWHVVNMHKKNAMGYPVGYMLHTEANALPLADPGDPPLSRAQFVNYHLWVTPYNPDELFAAGNFPNQSASDQGLPQWTSHHRNIADTDIVLWYTIGFHHIPAAEDWPVYSLGWHSFTLSPFNFFDQNPALDVPGK